MIQNSALRNTNRCPICGTDFDETSGIPKLLPCTHTICSFCIQNCCTICIEGMMIDCPLCMESYPPDILFPIDTDMIQEIRREKALGYHPPADIMYNNYYIQNNEYNTPREYTNKNNIYPNLHTYYPNEYTNQAPLHSNTYNSTGKRFREDYSRNEVRTTYRSTEALSFEGDINNRGLLFGVNNNSGRHNINNNNNNNNIPHREHIHKLFSENSNPEEIPEIPEIYEIPRNPENIYTKRDVPPEESKMNMNEELGTRRETFGYEGPRKYASMVRNTMGDAPFITQGNVDMDGGDDPEELFRMQTLAKKEMNIQDDDDELVSLANEKYWVNNEICSMQDHDPLQNIYQEQDYCLAQNCYNQKYIMKSGRILPFCGVACAKEHQEFLHPTQFGY